MFPAKKPKGNLGREIKLRVNHYRINIKRPFTVYQYDLELTKLKLNESKPDLKKPEPSPIKNKTIMRFFSFRYLFFEIFCNLKFKFSKRNVQKFVR